MMISPPDVKRWKRGTLVLPTSAAPPSDVILLHFRHAEVWHARSSAVKVPTNVALRAAAQNLLGQMRSGGLGCASTVAVGAMGLFTLSTAGNMAAKAVKQYHYKQKLKVSPQCIECTGKGRMSCDICQDSKMIECHNEVFLRARQIVVCPGCGGKGDRECPNCYGEGVNTAAA